MKYLVLVLAALAVPVVAVAHHSRAEFSDEVEEIEGELVEVRWFNPHAAFILRVVDETRGEQLWRVETFSGPRPMARFGVTGDLFRTGERVKIAGRKSKYRQNYLLGTNVLLPNGTEVLVGEDGRRWASGAVIGSGLSGTEAVDDEQLRAAAGENKGIFRVWSVSDRSVTQFLPFTESALAARARWDPAAEPITRCEQPGMPVTMWPLAPIEFIDQGSTILLRSQYFDTVRSIHLDASAIEAARAISPTHLGYSVGRWEGSTLIVETTKISYPRFDTSGTPQSDSVSIVERFAVSDDQSRLDLHMTITDKSTFKEPATFSRYYLALGQSLVAFDCKF
jgi:hypothetical protein